MSIKGLKDEGGQMFLGMTLIIFKVGKGSEGGGIRHFDTKFITIKVLFFLKYVFCSYL